MIVQCGACQTRFRLADEKIKPGGTKVRCSKCKTIFTVALPPAEPAEEAIDYGSFNMEPLAEEEPAPPAATTEAPRAGHELAAEPPPGAEPAADPGQRAAVAGDRGEEASQGGAEAGVEAAQEQAADAAALAQGVGAGEPVDFDFGADGTVPAAAEFSFDAEETAPAAAEFSFDAEDDSGEQEPPGEFDFADQDEGAFSFDDEDEAPLPAARQDDSEPGEFTFDEESPFDEDGAAEWSAAPLGDDVSFDFEEPSFDSPDPRPAATAASSSRDDLQFGEIDFADSGEGAAAPGRGAEQKTARPTLAQPQEPAPFIPVQPSPAQPAREYQDQTPRPITPAKKSSLSRILVLLVLLLVTLGGAAGLLFVQEGSVNLNAVAQYLPFLQDYLGDPPPVSPGDRIGINITGSSYVNGQAGQMLVIQGTAVNKHTATRSAITIKGVLLDAQGQTLLQQTVFCGNHLDDEALSSMPFAAIEEAMNNQFGDSLSNMNVAAGATIPFTIVFRNLPAGIASINVEVVDSKPGAG